jgi:hypothetical protein
VATKGKPKAAKVVNPTMIESLICKKDWDCNTAVAIAKAESGLRCNAINTNNNKSVDSGLFQINSVHKAKYQGKNIFDCETNIEVAYQIYKNQGWSPWITYKNGKHIKFLK